MKLQAFALAALFAPTISSVHAIPLTYSSNVVAEQATNWSGFLDLQQFDASLGTLQSVTVDLYASLAGSAMVESHNNIAAHVTLNLQAQLKLVNPNDPSSILVATTPKLQQSFAASSYDFTQDYAGSSGATFTGLAVSTSNSTTFSDAVTLALFTGQGFVRAPLSAAGGSSYSGPGNVLTSMRTKAGGYATVSYEYQPIAVPEPNKLALTLAGLAMLGLLAWRCPPA